MKLIRKFALAIMFTFSVVGMLLMVNRTNLYASNLVITGDRVGISITPSNEDLFAISNMLLGETAVSGIEISNTDVYPFKLNVNVKIIESDQQDAANLLDILDIIVSMDGEEIANFPAKGGDHYLGRFVPGQTAQLDIYLALNGKNAGNEYQTAIAELQWIFEAVSENAPIIPTPDPTPEPTAEPTVDSEETSTSTTETEPTEEQPYIPSDHDEPTEERDIDEIPVALAMPEQPDEEGEIISTEEEPDIRDIPDKPVPLVEMPKTGEASLYISTIAGLAAIGLGLVMLRAANRGNKRG